MIYSALLEEQGHLAFFPFPAMKSPVHIFTDVLPQAIISRLPHLITLYKIERKSLEA